MVNANTFLVNIIKDMMHQVGGGRDLSTNLLKWAFGVSLVRSWGAAIMYSILLVITFVFLIIYIKRMLMTCFLAMIAPLITITYSIDKIGNNKSEILNQWIKEFSYNVLIQPFHCLVYVVFVSTAMNELYSAVDILDIGKMIMAIAYLLCIFIGERIIREIFGFTKSKSVASKLFTGKMVTTAIKDAKQISESRNQDEEDETETQTPTLMPDGSSTEEAMEEAAHPVKTKEIDLSEEGIRTATGKETDNLNPNTNKNLPPIDTRTRGEKVRQKINDVTPTFVQDIGRAYVGGLATVTGAETLERRQEKRKRKLEPSFQEQFLIAAENYRKTVNPTMTNKQLAQQTVSLGKIKMKDLTTAADANYRVWVEKMKKDLTKRGVKNTDKAISELIETKDFDEVG